MKIQWLLGAALCAATLGAAAQTAQESVTIPAPRLQIVVPAHTYQISRWDFADLPGIYELANGQTLRLRHNGFAMFAQLDDESQHRVVATGPSSFVALDRQLQVRIELREDGTYGGEVLIATPARMAATDQPQEVIRLALR